MFNTIHPTSLTLGWMTGRQIAGQRKKDPKLSITEAVLSGNYDDTSAEPAYLGRSFDVADYPYTINATAGNGPYGIGNQISFTLYFDFLEFAKKMCVGRTYRITCRIPDISSPTGVVNPVFEIWTPYGGDALRDDDVRAVYDLIDGTVTLPEANNYYEPVSGTLENIDGEWIAIFEFRYLTELDFVFDHTEEPPYEYSQLQLAWLFYPSTAVTAPTVCVTAQKDWFRFEETK